MRYAVNEVYVSIQGEGLQSGRPAVFVRLQGCPVGCPFCDTKYTWALDPAHCVATLAEAMADPGQWCWLETADLVAAISARALAARWVVLTGGEPLDQDCDDLITACHRAGYGVQIETSGTAPLGQVPPDWLTVSPKVGMPGGRVVRPELLRAADEIKHVVGKLRDLHVLDALLLERDRGLGPRNGDGVASPRGPAILLQPMSESEAATRLCVATCLARGYRLSVQTHKLIGVA